MDKDEATKRLSAIQEELEQIAAVLGPDLKAMFVATAIKVPGGVDTYSFGTAPEGIDMAIMIKKAMEERKDLKAAFKGAVISHLKEDGMAQVIKLKVSDAPAKEKPPVFNFGKPDNTVN